MKGYRLLKIRRDAGGFPFRWRINAPEEGSGKQLYSRNYGWLWTADQLTEFVNRPVHIGEEFEVETLVS